MGTSTNQAALRLGSLTPKSGPLGGDVEIELRGSGFAGKTIAVFFGSQKAQSVTVTSDTLLQVTLPSASTPGAVDVKISDDFGQSASLPQAFTYLEDAQATKVFCKLQEQSPASSALGMPSGSLYALIYAEGLTQGAGQGGGVSAELGWGPLGSDPATYTFAPMSYNVDKDGLTPGDQANDEYGATLTLNEAGEYGYVARIKVQGLQEDWLYCDLDGSENGFSSDQAGRIQVKSITPASVEFCKLQAQSPATLIAGMRSEPLYAVIFVPGVTTGPGAGLDIEAQLGWGKMAAAPESFAFVPMAYNVDKDGLAPGDQANDEYGATLTLPVAGEYRYVARARAAANQPWLYCDLEGVGSERAFDPDKSGELKVMGQAPAIGFCVTESTSLSSLQGDAVQVTGVVYVKGKTDQVGAPLDVTASLFYGPKGSDPATWTASVPATWKEDVDGVTPGDRSNDRFEATLNLPQAGDYAFAFRFATDAGATVANCDLDGSSSLPASFEPTKVGTLSVTATNLPDRCLIQFPAVISDAAVGTPLSVYGRIFEPGITDTSDGDARIKADLYVGPITADPLTQRAQFTKVMAALSTTYTNQTDDEYEATWTPTAPGDYRYFYTFSVDGGQSESLCGLGDGTAFSPQLTGVFQVQALAQDPPDYCRVFQGVPGTPVTHSLADPTEPIFTAEIYEPGITDTGLMGANSDQIVVEIGIGKAGINPALPGAFDWLPLPFSELGATNNYKYQGAPLYKMLPAPADYKVLVRARRMNQTAWTWCDTFPQTRELLLERMSDFTLLP